MWNRWSGRASPVPSSVLLGAATIRVCSPCRGGHRPLQDSVTRTFGNTIGRTVRQCPYPVLWYIRCMLCRGLYSRSKISERKNYCRISCLKAEDVYIGCSFEVSYLIAAVFCEVMALSRPLPLVCTAPRHQIIPFFSRE